MIYSNLLEKKSTGKKSLAVLIDPEVKHMDKLEDVVRLSLENGVDYFFVGGSLIIDDALDQCISYLKSQTQIPVVLFPGNGSQIHSGADGILLLSLISGRNPNLLIGQHVESAVKLKRSGLEIMPTGYLLIESGRLTTAHYMSNTQPIPNDKPEIAVSTALAGELLGLKLIYLDAGSGAQHAVSPQMVSMVSSGIDVPLIIGGGITTTDQAAALYTSGADVIVVGNCIEKDPTRIKEFSKVKSSF